jgi:hypothetical protein
MVLAFEVFNFMQDLITLRFLILTIIKKHHHFPAISANNGMKFHES